jgi:hypothetical protein
MRKLQIPNTKHQRSFKHRAPNVSSEITELVACLSPDCRLSLTGAWNLNILWSLEVGIWSFSCVWLLVF